MRNSLVFVLAFALLGIVAGCRLAYEHLLAWLGYPVAGWIVIAAGLILAAWAIVAIGNAASVMRDRAA